MKATETKDVALITGACAAQSRESTTSVTIGIIGASGAVGSAVAQHLMRSCILKPGDRVLLVGHGTVANERKLLALRSDLLDAFDQNRMQIEVAPDIDGFEADIVVVAAGATISAEHKSRRDLALVNLPIFERIAEACAMRLPRALIIVVSNPVELAVEVLATSVDRHRVLGMGAQQDSLRFARAIANDLGLSRHDVRASVFGEHGDAMAPLWQSVALSARAAGYEHQLSALKAKAAKAPLKTRVAMLEQQVNAYLAKGDIAAAYRVAADSLPDARIFVEPRITAQSIHSTPNATANATVQLVAAALAADGRAVHGQVQLRREAFGIEGVCGVPIVINRDGWTLKDVDYLSRASREAIVESARSIRSFNARILRRAGHWEEPPTKVA
jgi:malate dehydrogenase